MCHLRAAVLPKPPPGHKWKTVQHDNKVRYWSPSCYSNSTVDVISTHFCVDGSVAFGHCMITKTIQIFTGSINLPSLLANCVKVYKHLM